MGTAATVKIMPLGNSITQLDWQGGYRRLLKDSLVIGGFSTDFVGSNNYGQANWANPDYEHEGYGSATITRAAGTAYPHIETAAGRMTTYQPEIVIVELGTNDLYSGGRTPTVFRDDMRKLLDTIWRVNLGIKIVLSTIIPPDTLGRPNLVPLWFKVITTNALFPALVAEKVAQGKTIVLADVYASFMPPESVKAYILDGVHPSYDGWNGHPVGGYRRMAKAIYPRVKELINGTPPPPFTPTLLLPPNGSANYTNTLSLNWSASSRAINYRLQLSTDSTFTTTMYDDSTLTDTLKQVSSLLNNTSYYWRVRAGNSVGWSEWSMRWKFTVVVLAPTLLTPANDSTQRVEPIYFSWFTELGEASKFWFQVSVDSNFANLFYNDSSLTVDSLSLSGFQVGVKYFWRVRAIYPNGISDWSSVWNFRYVKPVSVKLFNDIPNRFFLHNNYPNPFNPTTKIKYDLPIASKVTLKVYNILGQEVATLRDEIEEPGFKSVELNGSTLSSGVSAKGASPPYASNEGWRGYASGVYFYRLTAGEYISTKKFLLLK
jgi:lysophospholipase L1-like esterase